MTPDAKTVMIRAVGFDLGGTLMDYQGIAPSWELAYDEALAAVVTTWDGELTEAMIAGGRETLRRYNTRLSPRVEEVDHLTIFGELLDVLDAPEVGRVTLVEMAADAFFGIFRSHAIALPGAVETIRSLHRSGVRTGVLTDVPYGMPRRALLGHLAAAQLGMLDAALLTSVEVGTRKPDPEGFFCLAMVLGCAPAEVLFVGDEEKDIDGARAAGMTAALVWRGDGQSPQYGQHFTVASLSELPALVTSGPS